MLSRQATNIWDVAEQSNYQGNLQTKRLRFLRGIFQRKRCDTQFSIVLILAFLNITLQ